MNPIFKAFCRVYQFAFYAAIPLLPYRNPEVLHSTEELIPVLKERGIQSLLLVTDGQLRRSGVTKQLETLLEQNQIRCAVYDGTNPNPTVKNVEAARGLYLERGC